MVDFTKDIAALWSRDFDHLQEVDLTVVNAINNSLVAILKEAAATPDNQEYSNFDDTELVATIVETTSPLKTLTTRLGGVSPGRQNLIDTYQHWWDHSKLGVEWPMSHFFTTISSLSAVGMHIEYNSTFIAINVLMYCAVSGFLIKYVSAKPAYKAVLLKQIERVLASGN